MLQNNNNNNNNNTNDSSSSTFSNTTNNNNNNNNNNSGGCCSSGNNNLRRSNSNLMDVIRDCSPTRPKLTKTSERQPKNALDQMSQLRKSNELCDIVLVVGNSRIKAHKIVLAASSPYFRAMFTGELAESKQTEVNIRDVDETAMEILIDFCYTSKITIDEKIVQTLLPAACLLQLQEVQDYCAEFLRSQLDPTNCLGIRAFADTHSCRELLKIADNYMRNNFSDVIESEEFLLLPIDQLIEIISNDELNVKNEEQVYQAMMSWIRFGLEERKIYLAQLLEHVRLPLIDCKYLVKFICNDPFVKSDPVCRDLIDEAKDYHLLPQERSQMQGPRTKPRKPFLDSHEVVFAAGGWCSGDAIASVEMFDPQNPKNEWKLVANLHKRRCGVGVAVLNQQLYAIGGHDGNSYLNSVERYDPNVNQWYMDVAPTTSCRTSVGVAVLDSYLYAIGGQDGVSCLNFVEKYDYQSNKWTRVASMNQRRLGVAVAVLGNYVYAIGGSDGSIPLKTVERYDPVTNKWSFVASMSTARKHLGCAVYKNYIYAVGGRDDMSELNSVERYNAQADEWTSVTPLKSKRSGVGLAVVNGQLMAIGGFDGSSYLKTIEIYDNELDEWKLSGSMIYRRLGGGVGVIKLEHRESSALFKSVCKATKANNTSTKSISITQSRNGADGGSMPPMPRTPTSTPSVLFSPNGSSYHHQVHGGSYQPAILSPAPLLANSNFNTNSNTYSSNYLFSFSNSNSPNSSSNNNSSSGSGNMFENSTTNNHLNHHQNNFAISSITLSNSPIDLNRPHQQSHTNEENGAGGPSSPPPLAESATQASNPMNNLSSTINNSLTNIKLLDL